VEGNLTVTTYNGGLNGTEVVLYTINGGGHGWPSEIPTNDLIWRFFEQHPRLSA
jgi:polyhydroxybutyrate depolymerase